MNRHLCTILCFLIYGVALGQDLPKYNRIIFKVAPLSFVDKISFQSALAGFEFRFAPEYSVDFSYGAVFGKDISGNKGNGFKTKIELRRYAYDMKNSKVARYFALEGFCNKVDFSESSSFESSIDSLEYTDNYEVNKNIWGINLKYGIAFNVLKVFVFEASGGVGIRYKNVQHLNRTNPEDSFYDTGFNPDEEGKYKYPNLTAIIKFGYVIM